jgi:hypothetical protein
LAGTAVNVTRSPAQTGFADGEITILTGKTGFTVMDIGLEVAGLPDAHGDALEVSSQVIRSLFAGVYE